MTNLEYAEILEFHDVIVTRNARNLQDGTYFKGIVFSNPDGERREHFVPNDVVHDLQKLRTLLARNGM
ncbi:hypothetical protein MD537_26950, partial [Flavihumibacter sediminis]|nr:hypothetical protein [Flavihumibacter sediminis]